MAYRVIEPADFLHWENVKPGDMLRAPGTVAWKLRDFPPDDLNESPILHLRNGLLLVLSRYEGCPESARGKWLTDYAGDERKVVTFVVLSRHGPLVVIQTKRVR